MIFCAKKHNTNCNHHFKGINSIYQTKSEYKIYIAFVILSFDVFDEMKEREREKGLEMEIERER